MKKLIWVFVVLGSVGLSDLMASEPELSTHDSTYLGKIVREFSPEKSNGTYVFNIEDVLGIKHMCDHKISLQCHVNLPEFTFIKLHGKFSKNFMLLYPQLGEVLLSVLGRNQRLMLLEFDSQKKSQKYCQRILKQLWLPYSSVELIDGHVAALLQNGAVGLHSFENWNRYFCQQSKLNDYFPDQDVLFVSTENNVRCLKLLPEDFPVLGLDDVFRQILSEYIGSFDDPFNFSHKPTQSRALEITEMARAETAYLAGLINRIENMDHGQSKKERFGQLISNGDQYPNDWMPPRFGWSMQAKNVQQRSHACFEEWRSLGQHILTEIQKNAGECPFYLNSHDRWAPKKPYGEVAYEERRSTARALKRVRMDHELTFSDSDFHGTSSKEIHLNQYQRQELIGFLTLEKPAKLNYLKFDSLNPFTVISHLSDFMENLPGLRKFDLRNISMSDFQMEQLLHLWMYSSHLDHLSIDQGISQALPFIPREHQGSLNEKSLKIDRVKANGVAAVNLLIDSIAQMYAGGLKVRTLSYLLCEFELTDYATHARLLRPSVLMIEGNSEYMAPGFEQHFISYLQTHHSDLIKLKITGVALSLNETKKFLNTLLVNNTIKDLRFSANQPKKYKVDAEGSNKINDVVFSFLNNNACITSFSMIHSIESNNTYIDHLHAQMAYNRTWEKISAVLGQDVETIDPKLLDNYACYGRLLKTITLEQMEWLIKSGWPTDEFYRFLQPKVLRNLQQVFQVNRPLYEVLLERLTKKLTDDYEYQKHQARLYK